MTRSIARSRTPKWPRRPVKLEPDCAWVSVVKVEGGNGDPADELAWCVEYVACLRYNFRQIAKDAAECWYRETDQSGQPTVTLRIEDATGRDITLTCRVVMNPVVRVIDGSDAQLCTRVGHDPAAEKHAARWGKTVPA